MSPGDGREFLVIPVGSFQAVKHRCARMHIEFELARSVAYAAAFSPHEDESELTLSASHSNSFCSDAFLRSAAENLQVHGGIEFTGEHACHLYLKRAKSSQLLFGTPRQQRRRLARLLLESEAENSSYERGCFVVGAISRTTSSSCSSSRSYPSLRVDGSVVLLDVGWPIRQLHVRRPVMRRTAFRGAGLASDARPGPSGR